MGANAEAVVEAALRLPKAELEEVVERLLASLDSTQAQSIEVDAAWAAEAERRLGELSRGEVTPIPWPEVRAAARARVQSRDE